MGNLVRTRVSDPSQNGVFAVLIVILGWKMVFFIDTHGICVISARQQLGQLTAAKLDTP